MGVSGSGKSFIGAMLAKELGLPFMDADDYHPESNIKKMSEGIPLNDDDRAPWLKILNGLAKENKEQGCVIACSALKEKYRKQLSESLEDEVQWYYLKGDYELILKRMKAREGHFMGVNMLQSQFETLEEPENAIVLDIKDSPAEIIKRIKKQ